MRLVYTLLLYLLAPFFVLRLLIKSRGNPAYRERWLERFGFIDPLASHPSIWIHAVSVGEAQATQQLVKSLKATSPELQIVMSTTTPTGARHVENIYGKDVLHRYFPYDLPGSVRRWLDRVEPDLLVLMETEIWPNLIAACKKRGIPVVLANARLSERSAVGYGRLGRFTGKVLSCIRVIAAQSEADAGRFVELGYPRENISITGSIKFDTRQAAIVKEQAEAMRRLLGVSRPIWIASSTRDGEEESVLAAHRLVLESNPAALLLLVPRHPERFDKVAQLCRQRGFSLITRSSGDICDERHDVFLGDSMGELGLYYQAADVAFVGGSLVDKGGQNIMEPASLGLPVVFGPSMYNFAAISQLLIDQEAAVQVDDSTALADQVIAWLSDASARAHYGENGRRVVEENRGATERLMRVLEKLLPVNPASTKS
jgi:3-deoxy-D-manno-octulosonic-acid transferase